MLGLVIFPSTPKPSQFRPGNCSALDVDVLNVTIEDWYDCATRDLIEDCVSAVIPILPTNELVWTLGQRIAMAPTPCNMHLEGYSSAAASDNLALDLIVSRLTTPNQFLHSLTSLSLTKCLPHRAFSDGDELIA
ncbi:hypothetical protein GGF32_005743 [Allomyces javanicus]|nr:hypothetical protein GGF32_005743 [Allomyces javanicus]